MEKELKPKQWILVRDADDEVWRLDIFSHYCKYDEYYPFCCIGNIRSHQCISYEGNEELLDTTDSPKEKYEPKDGEFVHFSQDCIGIFQRKEHGFSTSHHDYACYRSTTHNIIFDEGCWTMDNLCPATEEEKQFLLSKLHEIGKDWDAENKKIVDYKWQPNKGDEYYILQYSSNDDEFLPLKMWWNNTEYDKGRMKEGIAYRTKEECQKVCDRRNEVNKDIK